MLGLLQPGRDHLGVGMNIWTELARASTAVGDEIILRRRNDLYEIRYNGVELMCDSSHQSEEFLAEKALRLLGRPARRILIGGLGLGFTLRMALNYLDDDAEVTVSEIVPEIVDWNRRHLGHLAGHPLNDARVEIRVEDVMETLKHARGSYDVVLMDTDNGPDHTVRTPNGVIYDGCGISAVKQSLSPDGIAAFWSATMSPEFEERLDAAQWNWRCDCVSLLGGRVDAFHYVYLASRDVARLNHSHLPGETGQTEAPAQRVRRDHAAHAFHVPVGPA